MEPKPRILAVDDDEDILYTLRAIGEMAGWHVETSAYPEEAVGLACDGGFDVVVADYHMPGMDGLAFVRAVRAQNPEVPIVVLTVDERMALAERFREAGANDFAIKPVKAADFISRIRLHMTSTDATRAPSAHLPKGITQQTMDLILGELRDRAGTADGGQDDGVAAEDLAARVGIAYQTVWRYMDALERDGVVEARLDYGRRGRPKKLYRLKRQLPHG
ncbi:MAG: response regulator [Firmicutes bacterium]|jgi:CheY-like chemotaxis protein/biotin operon repressor|nr:response regulator [Bacillota bacterium]